MSRRRGAAVGRSGARRLVINPAFGVFWVTRTASLFGDYAFRIAFITSVVKSSRSPDVLAIATAVLLVPAVGPLSASLGSRTALMVTGGAIVALSLAVCAMPAIRELRLPQMGRSGTAEPGQVHVAAPASPQAEGM